MFRKMNLPLRKLYQHIVISVYSKIISVTSNNHPSIQKIKGVFFLPKPTASLFLYQVFRYLVSSVKWSDLAHFLKA